MADWDVIVLGLGGVGSSAAFHLASQGHRVLGIDQYEAAHSHGSSHGKTRIIRQAYFEHPAYVPLLRRAYQLWDELERRSGQQLFDRTGLVEIGPADGIVIRGVKRSAREHGLTVQDLTMSEVTSTWPGLTGQDDWQAVLEQDAGFLRVESCVQAHLTEAARAGAVCRHNQRVQGWQIDGQGVRVIVENSAETADHLVVACGPWTPTMAGELGIELSVLRKHQYWFAARDSRYDRESGFPCFFYETDAGYFYGFPSIAGGGVKVARHSGGQRIAGPSEDLGGDDRDKQPIDRFVSDCLPGVSDRLLRHCPCYYTMTADEHFIIDRVGEHKQVTVIAGLSGHGYKFTSVLGEVAGQLVSSGSARLDVSLFRIERFQGPRT